METKVLITLIICATLAIVTAIIFAAAIVSGRDSRRRDAEYWKGFYDCMSFQEKENTTNENES